MKTIGKHIIGSLLFLLTSAFAFAQNAIDQVDTSYDGVTKLIVRGSFCDVNVVGGSSSNVALNGKISGSGNRSTDIKIMHRQSGNTLEVWIDRPNGGNWSWGWNSLNGKLDLKVPSNIELMVDNSSGDVSVQNITYATCEVTASSGDVKVENITANLKIGATSGDISAMQIKGNVKARTTSGSQRLETINGGTIQADATSGNIRIDTAEGDIQAETTSGSLDIENTKGVLDLRSTSGDIEGKGITLTGSSNFKSSSGEIDMRLKNDLKTLSFDLQASSGSLSAGGIRSDRKLFMKNGSNTIEIRGVSSSGNQSYNSN